MFHLTLDVNFMVENVIQIESGIKITVNVSVNPSTCACDSFVYLKII